MLPPATLTRVSPDELAQYHKGVVAQPGVR
jgi:hypothetical protein